MTTPLLVVLAALIAGAGYAAGRVHQWHRTSLERDEAYREGYDTATRSTLSLAARLVGPRRDKAGVRASAAVQAGRASAAAAPAAGPLRAAPPHTPSVLSPRASSTAAAEPQPIAFFAPSTSDVTPSAAAPASPAAASPTLPAAASPTLPAAAGLSPPAAAGPTLPAAAGRATPGAPAPAPDSPEAADPPQLPRPGRHLVPDELVRAATYRLAPDRVARAKVHGAGHPGDDDAPPARPPVPKPRSS